MYISIPKLDISTAVQVAFFLALCGSVLSIWMGIRTLRSAARLNFFRKRRDAMLRGWKMILIAVIMGALAFALRSFAEPAIYTIFPPSPTITLTPTITITPTITLSSTISLTPTITETPAESPTPQIPPDIATQFTSQITPNPDSLFSIIEFSKTLEDNLPVDPAREFTNPVGLLYGTFQYNNMIEGSQWTAIWYRKSDQTIICLETKPWDESTGGYSYTECNPPSMDWLPGDYEVQIFVGLVWMSSGEFTIAGDPATPTPTPSPSRTLTSTQTIRPSRTITLTATPTRTRTRTIPPTPTRTPPPTSTIIPSWTPRATDTRWPSPTSIP